MIKKAIISLLLFSSLAFCSQDHLPTASDINAVTEQADKIIGEFRQDSFELRMRYEFAGRFLTTEDRLALLSLADKAGNEIQPVITKQQEILRQIEEYEGADWEKLYGQTHLWSKISYRLHISLSNKCLFDSYRLVTTDPQKRDEILRTIKKQLKEAPQKYSADIAKARAFVLLAQSEPEYKDPALKELKHFMFCSDIYSPTSAEIEKVKLLNAADHKLIKNLIERLDPKYGRHQELFIQLVILQRKYDFNGYLKSFERFSGIRPFFCRLISHSLIYDQNFEVHIKEAEMIADFALRTNALKHREVLESLYEKKSFRTPLILYTFAQALEKEQPRKSIELLFEASRLHKESPDPELDIDSNEIAGKAALIAYQMYIQDANCVEFPAKVFQDYKSIAGTSINESIEWQFAQMYLKDLDSCVGFEILKNIRKRNGNYARQAILYLAARGVRIDVAENPNERLRLLDEFATSLADQNDCVYQLDSFGLVLDTLIYIDLFEAEPDKMQAVVEDCETIGRFIFEKCDMEDAGPLIAEAIIINPSSTPEKLKQAKKFAEGQGKLQARSEQRSGNYRKAVKLWEIVVYENKRRPCITCEYPWRLWQGYYYQFDCALKAGQDKSDIGHAVDVLLASYPEIPRFWADKLRSLKQ